MMRVLVVDDMPENLRLVRKVLAPAGFTVETAGGGGSALKAAGGAMPDVILLDLRLGEEELSGFELAGRLRLLPGGDRVAIIALSGGAVLEDEAASKAAGCDAFISKPFDAAALPELIRKYAALRPGPPAV